MITLFGLLFILILCWIRHYFLLIFYNLNLCYFFFGFIFFLLLLILTNELLILRWLKSISDCFITLNLNLYFILYFLAFIISNFLNLFNLLWLWLRYFRNYLNLFFFLRLLTFFNFYLLTWYYCRKRCCIGILRRTLTFHLYIFRHNSINY